MHHQSFAVTDIGPDNKVIDMTQRRMRQRAVASPAFTASLVDAIDALREIAGIDPDPGPSAQWWDKLDWYLRGRQRRNDQGPTDPAEYFLAGYLHGRERLEWERQQDREPTSQRPPLNHEEPPEHP
jgi:hypothetical protein